MAAIDDLLKQIDDPRLRERIASEWRLATKEKKFGLVYERHLPELVPIYSEAPKKGDLVCRKDGKFQRIYRVQSVNLSMAQCLLTSTDEAQPSEISDIPVDELVVVRQFGDPIFPTLTPIDQVKNGPDHAPWHTLIEADNYHALQLLEYLYAGKVDCIYIDPPYNTGARDWKYNNDYVDGNDAWRHSKWLSFMEKRLLIARRLLNPDDGVLICTIDEHEVHHLGNLLEQIFPDAYRQMVTIVITSRGVAAQGLARVEEYAIYNYLGNASASKTNDNFLTVNEDGKKPNPWASLLRRGTNASPSDRAGLVYPIFVDPDTREILSVGETLDSRVKRGDVAKENLNDMQPERHPGVAWPTRSDGRLGTWQVGPSTLMNLKDKGYVKLGRYDGDRSSWSVNYLKRGPITQIENGELIVTGHEWAGGPTILEYADELGTSKLAKSVWYRTEHDAGTYGSSLLQEILRSRAFEFPKSLYVVRDTLLTILGERKDALILDFFAGSGTTLHATNLLNLADSGERRCILVTNNEVSSSSIDALNNSGCLPGDEAWEIEGICRSVTWPRSKYSILGQRDDGSKLSGEYSTGIERDVEKRRKFVHLHYVMPSTFEGTGAKKKQKSLLGMIEGLPQKLIHDVVPFVASEDYEAAVLFNPDEADNWLEALGGMDHITEFYIVAETEPRYREIKARVEQLLGPQIVQEEEKRPMADGFASNLAYFKLDFLNKDKVELGAAFREILPLLWLKAGGFGERPELPSGDLPAHLIPSNSNFAVLLKESRVRSFAKAVAKRKNLKTVYVVTDSEEAFRAIADDVRDAIQEQNPDTEFIQLYRDYLMNFVINTPEKSNEGLSQ